jgi:GT2 family glycosyltransferase
MDLLKDIACSEEFDAVLMYNASSDKTLALLSRIEGATCVLNDSNRGFAAAVNQALGRRPRDRYFTLLNPDAFISASGPDLEDSMAKQALSVPYGKQVVPAAQPREALYKQVER